MDLNNDRQKNIRQLIQFTRLGLFWLVLILTLSFYLLQKNFLNLNWLLPIYGLLSIAFFQQFILIQFEEKLKDQFILFSFILDALFISSFIYFSGSNQSFFMFLHLVNILLAGIYFQTTGAMIVAFSASISLTINVLLSETFDTQNIIFILGLNHISFYVVAALSGFLSSQLLQTRKDLFNVEKLNQAMLDHLPIGLLTVKSDGEVIISNPQLMQLFNLQQLPQHISQLLNLDWLKIQKDFEITKINSFETEYTNTIDSQNVRTLKVQISQLSSEEFDDLINLVLISDLTEVRKLEYRMRQSEKMAAIGGLAAGIAHEIRNPLAGISGSIEMLSQNTQTEDDKKLMKIVLREIDRLNNLITEFLDYAKPETPVSDKVNLSQLINETLASLKLNQQLNQNIIQDLQIEKEILVLGKSDKLKQAFLNFFINSYQAMQTTAEPKLSVRLFRNGSTAEVRIVDNGVGMKEETRKRMFEPFHTTKPKGTGLGLAVTHKILENHHVEFFVRSELGQGTEVALTFPLVEN